MLSTKNFKLSVPECLRVLELAQEQHFEESRSTLKPSLSRLAQSATSGNTNGFGAKYLTRFLDHCSDLDILSPKMIKNIQIRLQELIESQTAPVDIHKCALALWSASLWHGVPTTSIRNTIMPTMYSEMMEQPVDWSIVNRLSWCIHNDPETKYDPSLIDRITAYISTELSPLSLKDIAELIRHNSKETGIVRKHALQRIISTVESPEFDLEILSEDPRISIAILRAWAEERIVPSNMNVFEHVLNRCMRSGAGSPDIICHSLATIGFLEMNPNWDPRVLKQLVVNTQWIPTVSQLSSLCGSFAALGLADMESTAYLANHLHNALVLKDTRYRKTDESLWEIGVWYSFIQMAASESTMAAVHDAYRTLTVNIASGMWDNRGLFVRKDDLKNIPPTERAIRTVVNESLHSLGITTIQNVHVVNTPFTAHLFLPDRDVAIIFVRKGEDILSDGRFTGTVRLAEHIISQRGMSVRVLNIEEYENSFNELTQDDFMDMLLRDIQ